MFEIHTSTIIPMLNIIDLFNAGIDVRDDLSVLLDHPDYKIEIERYNVHPAKIGFTKEDYINFFLNIRHIDKESITSKALKYRVEDLLYIMDHVDHYREMLKKLENIDYQSAINKTTYGLPDEVTIENVIIIFSIGLGVSGGWAYEHYTHYDLRMVVDKKTEQGLLNVIAHECHHIGHYKIILNEDILPEAKLIYLLSTEGTAVKFCNNFEGILTSRVYPEEEMSVSKISYDYYLKNFEEIYTQFKIDIESLRKGKSNAEEVFIRHYEYRDVKIDGVTIENYLTQPLKYQLGADLWGLIYDVFGRNLTLRCMINPNLFIKYYNDALDIKGMAEYKI